MQDRNLVSKIAGISFILIFLAALASGLTIMKLRADAIETAKDGAGNIATVLSRQTN